MSPQGTAVALVTGSGQGIGRGIALRLATDGYDIAVNDIPANEKNVETLAKEIQAIGRKAIVALADVTVEEEVKTMIGSVVKGLGGIDVMVANAGICRVIRLTETTAEDWDRTFSVNARGTFLCYKYAAIQMIEQGRGGRIIGAASCASKRGEPSLSAYSATKFAVRGLTQSAATELGPHKITVNTYAPGAIDTDMLRSIGTARGGWDGLVTREKNLAAVGYLGGPDDVANVVSFLASKESHFITGQSISVDGGRFFS